MKINGKISILIGSETTYIELHDDDAAITFAQIKLTPEQLSAALSRQGIVDCDVELSGLNKVGKIHECKKFEFEIPEKLNSINKEKELQALAQSQLKDGWIADEYFSSQGSFFKRDNKTFARVTIRRWLTPNPPTP